MPLQQKNSVHPKALLHSKWTAVQPLDKQKHFVVIKVIEPLDHSPIECVEIEAVLSKVTQRIAWRELREVARWQQGWR